MYVSFVYSVYNTMCIRMCYVRPHTPTHTRTHTHTHTHIPHAIIQSRALLLLSLKTTINCSHTEGGG